MVLLIAQVPDEKPDRLDPACAHRRQLPADRRALQRAVGDDPAAVDVAVHDAVEVGVVRADERPWIGSRDGADGATLAIAAMPAMSRRRRIKTPPRSSS
jgi:hypothetical protein